MTEKAESFHRYAPPVLCVSVGGLFWFFLAEILFIL
jgi:hypothetical protein